LPLDTGMAFVLVQHLEAKHESLLTDLLSKATRMPVTASDERCSVGIVSGPLQAYQCRQSGSRPA
jgi:chemotaxis response regulator CheB